MSILAKIMVAFVAVQHVGILILEMFLWSGPIGQKVFGKTAEEAQLTAVLGANQGLYNGFLAAGLVWALLHKSNETGRQLAYFFLACVFVAGLYGGYSVSYRIIFIQCVPSALAAMALLLNRDKPK